MYDKFNVMCLFEVGNDERKQDGAALVKKTGEQIFLFIIIYSSRSNSLVPPVFQIMSIRVFHEYDLVWPTESVHER